MDTVLFLLHIIKPLLVFYFRVEEKENFAGGKFREIPFAVDIIFAGGKFRAKSKFAKIAKIYSTRKIGVNKTGTDIFLLMLRHQCKLRLDLVTFGDVSNFIGYSQSISTNSTNSTNY